MRELNDEGNALFTILWCIWSRQWVDIASKSWHFIKNGSKWQECQESPQCRHASASAAALLLLLRLLPRVLLILLLPMLCMLPLLMILLLFAELLLPDLQPAAACSPLLPFSSRQRYLKKCMPKCTITASHNSKSSWQPHLKKCMHAFANSCKHHLKTSRCKSASASQEMHGKMHSHCCISENLRNINPQSNTFTHLKTSRCQLADRCWRNACKCMQIVPDTTARPRGASRPKMHTHCPTL